MSLHISIISIKGDARKQIPGFLEKCDYKIVAGPMTVSNFEAVFKVIKFPEDKGVTYHNSWTSIIDPEMVLMLDEETLAELSRQFGTVLTMICEGISSTYGFSVFKDGRKIRSIMITEDEIIEQSGNPLPEEAGIDYSEVFEDDIFKIMASLGFDCDEMFNAKTFLVYHLQPS